MNVYKYSGFPCYLISSIVCHGYNVCVISLLHWRLLFHYGLRNTICVFNVTKGWCIHCLIVEGLHVLCYIHNSEIYFYAFFMCVGILRVDVLCCIPSSSGQCTCICLYEFIIGSNRYIGFVYIIFATRFFMLEYGCVRSVWYYSSGDVCFMRLVLLWLIVCRMVALYSLEMVSRQPGFRLGDS